MSKPDEEIRILGLLTTSQQDALKKIQQLNQKKQSILLEERVGQNNSEFKPNVNPTIFTDSIPKQMRMYDDQHSMPYTQMTSQSYYWSYLRQQASDADNGLTPLLQQMRFESIYKPWIESLWKEWKQNAFEEMFQGLFAKFLKTQEDELRDGRSKQALIINKEMVQRILGALLLDPTEKAVELYIVSVGVDFRLKFTREEIETSLKNLESTNLSTNSAAKHDLQIFFRDFVYRYKLEPEHVGLVKKSMAVLGLGKFQDRTWRADEKIIVLPSMEQDLKPLVHKDFERLLRKQVELVIDQIFIRELSLQQSNVAQLLENPSFLFPMITTFTGNDAGKGANVDKKNKAFDMLLVFFWFSPLTGPYLPDDKIRQWNALGKILSDRYRSTGNLSASEQKTLDIVEGALGALELLNSRITYGYFQEFVTEPLERIPIPSTSALLTSFSSSSVPKSHLPLQDSLIAQQYRSLLRNNDITLVDASIRQLYSEFFPRAEDLNTKIGENDRLGGTVEIDARSISDSIVKINIPLKVFVSDPSKFTSSLWRMIIYHRPNGRQNVESEPPAENILVQDYINGSEVVDSIIDFSTTVTLSERLLQKPVVLAVKIDHGNFLGGSNNLFYVSKRGLHEFNLLSLVVRSKCVRCGKSFYRGETPVHCEWKFNMTDFYRQSTLSALSKDFFYLTTLTNFASEVIVKKSFGPKCVLIDKLLQDYNQAISSRGSLTLAQIQAKKLELDQQISEFQKLLQQWSLLSQFPLVLKNNRPSEPFTIDSLSTLSYAPLVCSALLNHVYIEDLVSTLAVFFRSSLFTHSIEIPINYIQWFPRICNNILQKFKNLQAGGQISKQKLTLAALEFSKNDRFLALRNSDAILFEQQQKNKKRRLSPEEIPKLSDAKAITLLFDEVGWKEYNTFFGRTILHQNLDSANQTFISDYHTDDILTPDLFGLTIEQQFPTTETPLLKLVVNSVLSDPEKIQRYWSQIISAVQSNLKKGRSVSFKTSELRTESESYHIEHLSRFEKVTSFIIQIFDKITNETLYQIKLTLQIPRNIAQPYKKEQILLKQEISNLFESIFKNSNGDSSNNTIDNNNTPYQKLLELVVNANNLFFNNQPLLKQQLSNARFLASINRGDQTL